MTYKIKRGNEQEEKFLLKRTKGHLSLQQLERYGFRKIFQISKAVHTKGEVVKYEGKIGRINKITNKGIYIQELNDEGFDKPIKEVFISEEKLESGKVYPLYLGID